MSGITLDGRLLSAAGYVRQNAVLADVGTDHGYLPLFLLQKGRISRAILTDINEGPLATARENLSLAGYLSAAELILTDGASALSGYGITDLTVCGMGGELISRIITEADFLHKEGVRLILQPMTKIAPLRRTLASLGFAVIAEHYSTADGRYYVTLVAEYSGTPCEISDVEAELGRADLAAGEESVCRSYLETRLASLIRERDGRVKGGLDASLAELLISETAARLSLL